MELQDLRTTDDDNTKVDQKNRDQVLWEALGSLSRRERLILALRLQSRLSRAETARVLRRPALDVARTERHALNELSLIADLGVTIATRPAAEPADDDNFQVWVSQAMQAHVDAPLDVQQLVRRLWASAAGIRQRPRRSPVLISAAAGLLAIGMASTLWWAMMAENSSSSQPLAARPPSPAGTQLVGYGSVAVAVPVGWRLNESACGLTASDGRVYRESAAGGQRTAVPGSSSVRFAAAPFDSPPLVVPPHRSSQVAGHAALRTAVTRVEGVYRQTVFVFSSGFMMTVRSPDRTVIAAIVSSVRQVPTGYTIVPYCQELPVTEAVSALLKTGLTSSIARTSWLTTRYGEPLVALQNLPPGSVVPESTPVVLTVPTF